MSIKNVHGLYLEGLRILYSAECQLIEAMPRFAAVASTAKLSRAVEAHLAESRNHRERLIQIFLQLDENPNGHESGSMTALLQEAEDMINHIDDEEVLDAGLIGAFQKMEHYEMAGYATARTLARILGHERQAELLEATYLEEAECDEMFSQISDSYADFARVERERPSQSNLEGPVLGQWR